MNTYRSLPIARTTIRKNEYGEYHVLAYSAAGERMPLADYFTDDLADAKQTAALMVNDNRSYQLQNAPRIGMSGECAAMYGAWR